MDKTELTNAAEAARNGPGPGRPRRDRRGYRRDRDSSRAKRVHAAIPGMFFLFILLPL